MKTKLIIVEGMDNTGKTTLINRLSVYLKKTHNAKVDIIHLTKPPADVKKEDVELYMQSYYDNLIDQLLNIKYYISYDYIILDRGYISEYVYGPLYRDRNRLDITLTNLIYDKRLMNLYGDNIFLILLNSEYNSFLSAKEDGESLSKINNDLLNKERILFQTGFFNSLFKNKQIYHVNQGDEFVDILPNVIMDLESVEEKM